MSDAREDKSNLTGSKEPHATPHDLPDEAVSQEIVPVEEPTKPKGEYPSRKDQWKPGQSGNPAGRPKGTGLTDRLRRVLDENEGEGAQALIDIAVKLAKAGDFRFWDKIYERVEGKVPDKLEANLGHTIKRIELVDESHPDYPRPAALPQPDHELPDGGDDAAVD